MSVQPLQIRLVPTKPIFTDYQSGADLNVAIYEPVFPNDGKDWYFLGHLAASLPDAQRPLSDPLVQQLAPAALIVRSDDSTALAPVVPDKKLWTSEHSGLTHPIEIYSLVAASGAYTSMGLFAFIYDQYNISPQIDPNWEKLRAIRSDLVSSAENRVTELQKVWQDSGSGAHGDGQWTNILLWNGHAPSQSVVGIRPQTFMISDAGNNYPTPTYATQLIPEFGLTINLSAVQLPPHATWMADTAAIHPLKLREICLPATHDSGTCAVGNVMDGGILSTIVSMLDEIPYVSSEIMESDVIPAIRVAATATHRTVLQQLMDGIRGFDLRVYRHADDYYVGHGGLIGARLSDIFGDIHYFLTISHGEILYITMGHWTNFDDATHLDFANFVAKIFGSFAYRPYEHDHIPSQRGGDTSIDLFDKTYTEILWGGGGIAAQKSRVLLVYDLNPLPYEIDSMNYFWGSSYSPPSSGLGENPPFPLGSTGIYGFYTDTESVQKMVAKQKAQYQTALANNFPFALYTTLTPSAASTGLRIILAVQQALGNYSWVNDVLNKIINIFNAELGIGLNMSDLQSPSQLPWRSLEDLASQVDSQFDILVKDNFVTSGESNHISLLYLDFYEKTNVVDLAIALSQINREVVILVPFLATVSDQSYSLPFAFYTAQVTYEYTGGHVFLSSRPDGSGPVYTDDQMTLWVTAPSGMQQNIVYDYSRGDSGQITPEPPLEITQLFGIGLNTVEIILTDLYHNSKGSSGYYLIHRP